VSTYTIGEVAERSGFSASALRYYEGIGLVPPSTRTGAGYRLYDDRSLARLGFIARAKQLGCSLEEITDLVAIWDGERCGPVQQRFHQLVTDKISDARRQIDELAALTEQLQAAAAQLAGPAVDGPCGPGCACLGDSEGASAVVPIALTRKPEVPIACTLGPGELDGRLAEWRVVLAEAADRSPIDGGLRISFRRSIDIGALARLVAAEQECCAFFSFAVIVAPDGVALDVHAAEEAAALVEELFGVVGA
jgi:DNA-binding transcriptional MerR regulator